MNTLLVQAIKKAGQILAKLKLNMFEPVNIFDVCATLGVTVRFIDVGMEGMYVNQEDAVSQVILISSLRPMPRRVYTCTHELGHHIFGHGSKVDGLTEEGASKSFYDNEEYLVDAFAGAFLMPKCVSVSILYYIIHLWNWLFNSDYSLQSKQVN